MRLYSRTGATAFTDPEYGPFEADEAGAFDFPDDVSDRIGRFHVGGKPAWENDVQRQQRLLAEERRRSQDPAEMLGLMQRLVDAAESKAPADPEAPAKAPVKRAARRTATDKD